MLKLALAQLKFVVGDFSGNAAKILDAARQAQEMGADVLLTSELSLAGYPPEDLLLRPAFIEACEFALTSLVAALSECHGLYVVIGHPHAEQGRLYNRVSVAYHGQIIGAYDKHYLPNDSVFDEQRYFQAGQSSFVFTVKGVPLGLIICEDAWQAQPSAQAVAAGAQLVLVANASPYHLNKGAEREAILRQRVEATAVPHIYVNAVGGQDELVFDGASFAVDGQQQVVLRMPQFVEGVAVLEYRDQQLLSAQVIPYASLEMQVYQALCLGLRDYVNQNGFANVIIGLSGGVDSALVLALACDALGKERVRTVMMPSRYTADISRIDARCLASTLGVRYDEIDIMPMVNAFAGSLVTEQDVAIANDVSAENIQARVRGTLLMALANKYGALVLTTSNKSETAVGYCTLYGDMAGGFSVLKDVAKMWVYRLCAWRNAQPKYAAQIPSRILTRAPSAELREDQTDQDSLPPYEILDEIIAAYVEKNQSIAQIVAAGHDQATVVRVVHLIKISEHKRRQAALGVRITPRAFGRDWRYPISTHFKG